MFEAQRKVELDSECRRVEVDRFLWTAPAAPIYRSEQQGSANPLSVMLSGDEQAAEVPEVFDKDYTNDFSIELGYKVDAPLGGSLPQAQVGGDILDGLKLVGGVDRVVDHPFHKSQDPCLVFDGGIAQMGQHARPNVRAKPRAAARRLAREAQDTQQALRGPGAVPLRVGA
nr:hypothetical protein [Rubrivivax albus]